MKNLSAVTDEQLMEALQEQQQEALTEFYQRYRSAMRGVILRILHDETEADDLLEEVVDEIWRLAKDFSPAIGRPLSWILTITRRRSIDRLRKRNSYGRIKDRFRQEIQQTTDHWSNRNLLTEIILSDERCYLDEVMQGLPDVQKQVIVLVYFQGLSQREIARKTHIPLGTVKTRIELGLNKMSAAMSGARDKIW